MILQPKREVQDELASKREEVMALTKELEAHAAVKVEDEEEEKRVWAERMR
jgi:hypothetical protein